MPLLWSPGVLTKSRCFLFHDQHGHLTLDRCMCHLAAFAALLLWVWPKHSCCKHLLSQPYQLSPLAPGSSLVSDGTWAVFHPHPHAALMMSWRGACGLKVSIAFTDRFYAHIQPRISLENTLESVATVVLGRDLCQHSAD